MELSAEQIGLIDVMLNHTNTELNRKENFICNLSRITEQEVWKKLSDTEEYKQFDKYEISNFGRIRSHHKDKITILNPTKKKNGYYQVVLCSSGLHKIKLIHRLVSACFVENSDPKLKNQINHRNHNKGDNFYKNLEWVSNQENTLSFINYDAEKVAEWKRKNSEANSGSNNAMYGMCDELSPNFGKKHSSNTKHKISKSHLGKKFSPETREKMSQSAKNRYSN